MRKIAALLLLLVALNLVYAENPKREFRGAWIHVIGQSQWMNKSPQQQQQYIRQQFDLLEEAGCNAVIFQVRPTADALYKSEYEPWSIWLTGKRGKAPAEDWDPLEYAVREAHKRGMELHAWLNPYRVTSDAKETNPINEDYQKHKERYFRYDNKIFFDPAYQENRDYICMIVKDIVKRYDVDAIHIDDYFYPYPAGTVFDADTESYAKFGKGMNKGDWRRENVNKLIEQIHTTIKSTKPWVRFGVSPFGIWRNKSTDPRGSNSNGLQNYDALFADPLYWAEKGWVDYLAPQLYWALDFDKAPSRHLAHWWNDNVNGADIYIGHDTRQTMNTADPKADSGNELGTKIRLSRELDRVKGNIWWHGYWVTENYKGVHNLLKNNYQSTLALAPAYGDPNKRPEPVNGLKLMKEEGRILLGWDKPVYGKKQSETDAVKFVVYEFLPGENTADLDRAETIITITPGNCIVLSEDGDGPIKGNSYVVTAIDRMNRESKPSKVKL